MKTIIMIAITIAMLTIVCSQLNDLIRLIALFVYMITFSYVIMNSNFIDKILKKLNKKVEI